VLPNGEMIAVKKLNSSMPGVKDKQFENEANHLMRLKHLNIVLLVGWCSETENIYVEHNGKYICAEKWERLLCLEYMQGNLRRFFFRYNNSIWAYLIHFLLETVVCGFNMPSFLQMQMNLLDLIGRHGTT
jgi:serine/threonine protein kinase